MAPVANARAQAGRRTAAGILHPNVLPISRFQSCEVLFTSYKATRLAGYHYRFYLNLGIASVLPGTPGPARRVVRTMWLAGQGAPVDNSHTEFFPVKEFSSLRDA